MKSSRVTAATAPLVTADTTDDIVAMVVATTGVTVAMGETVAMGVIDATVAIAITGDIVATAAAMAATAIAVAAARFLPPSKRAMRYPQHRLKRVRLRLPSRNSLQKYFYVGSPIGPCSNWRF